MPRLTVKAIEAAKPNAAEYKLTVERALYLRVAPSGVKTWVVRYVVNGKQRQARLPQPYGASGDGFMSLANDRRSSALPSSRATPSEIQASKRSPTVLSNAVNRFASAALSRIASARCS